MDAGIVARKPKNLDFAQAASLPLAGCTWPARDHGGHARARTPQRAELRRAVGRHAASAPAIHANVTLSIDTSSANVHESPRACIVRTISSTPARFARAERLMIWTNSSKVSTVPSGW